MKKGAIQRRANHRHSETARGRAEGGRSGWRHEISEATINTWKGKYGGMGVSEAHLMGKLS
jgi:hypothetical protein